MIAIAITLLVLPLVESASDLGSTTPQQILMDNKVSILVFIISFLVISRFWIVHNELLSPLKTFTTRLFILNTIWLMTIVIIPFTTQLISHNNEVNIVSNSLYIATLFVTTFVGLLMDFEIARSPRLWKKDINSFSLIGGVATTILMGVSLILTIAFPAVGLYSLLLLIFTGPFTTLLTRLYKK